jgi:guanylate kinase
VDKKLIRNPCVLLMCGPPASGKDTITKLMVNFCPLFVHFKKHRGLMEFHFARKPSMYYDLPVHQFMKMATNTEFVQYHQRYDRYYGISKAELDYHLSHGRIPIIHTGRIDNLIALETKLHVHTKSILIWAPLKILKARLHERHHDSRKEVKMRLKAAVEEFSDLRRENLDRFDVICHTNYPPEKVARRIISECQSPSPRFHYRQKEMLSSYLKTFDEELEKGWVE